MIPAPREMEDPLLVLIHVMGGPTGSVRSMQTYEPLADVLGVSKSEREEIRPDPKKGSIWHSTVQNSRKALVDKGLLLPFVQSERGMWTLTEKGRKAAEALVKQGLPFLAALRRRLGHAGTAP